MAEDLMRYDLLAQEALRGVVRASLRKVVKAAQGEPMTDSEQYQEAQARG